MWIGLIISTFLQFVVVGPLVFHATHVQSMLSIFIFTVASLIRGYCVRRWHANGYSVRAFAMNAVLYLKELYAERRAP
jgi:hypothetical protein